MQSAACEQVAMKALDVEVEICCTRKAHDRRRTAPQGAARRRNIFRGPRSVDGTCWLGLKLSGNGQSGGRDVAARVAIGGAVAPTGTGIRLTQMSSLFTLYVTHIPGSVHDPSLDHSEMPRAYCGPGPLFRPG